MANRYWFYVLWLAVSCPLNAYNKPMLSDINIHSDVYAKAEAQLHWQITTEPKDWKAQFKLAKLLAWQKKYKEADLQYQILLAREPGNADYLLGLAQVCVWRGDPLDALTLLNKAKAISPNDPDIWHLQIQALVNLEDINSRQQALVLQQQAFQRFPELKWPTISTVVPKTLDNNAKTLLLKGTKQDTILGSSHRNQVEMGGSYDHLSKNKGFWRSEYLGFEHHYATRKEIYGMFSQVERFDLNDEQFLLGGYYPLSSKLTMNLEGNVSPSPKVLASNSIMASMQVGLGFNSFLTGGFRHSEYQSGPLQQGFASLEHYFAGFRAAYTVRVTDSLNRTQLGHGFNASYYYQDISYFTFNYNMGAESTGYQGVVLDTQAFGLYGRHWFNQDWALSWALGHIEQGNAYNREGVSLGIRRAF